jgi:hypothetical protein
MRSIQGSCSTGATDRTNRPLHSSHSLFTQIRHYNLTRPTTNALKLYDLGRIVKQIPSTQKSITTFLDSAHKTYFDQHTPSIHENVFQL